MRIPTKRPSGCVIGRPETWNWLITSRACASVASGGSVAGLRMMPLALRLTLTYLLRLSLDGEILVNDADPPFLGEGDCHVALGHGVHGRAEQRDIQPNPPRKLGGDVHVARQDLAEAGFEEDVVEGQAESFDDLVAHRGVVLYA